MIGAKPYLNSYRCFILHVHVRRFAFQSLCAGFPFSAAARVDCVKSRAKIPFKSELSMSKMPGKRLIHSALERMGDFIITSIRFWRILGSGYARRTLFHTRKKNPPASALQKKRDKRKARRRRLHRLRRKKKSPRILAYVRLQRMRLSHFHRNSSPVKLIALYLGPVVVFSLSLSATFLSTQTKARTLPLPPPSLSAKGQLDELLNETVQLLADKRLDEAQKNLDVLNAKAPGNFTVLAHNAAMHMLRKNYPAARATYNQALAVNPGSSITRYNLAEIEFILKNYPEAERRFREMHDLMPQDETVLFRLVLCALLQYDDARAQRYLQKLSPAGRTPAWQYATAARLIQNKKNAEAARLLKQARTIFGDATAFYDTTFRELGFKE